MGKPKSGLQQDDLTPSTLPSDHTIVKLGAAQGSGNYLTSDAEGKERLVELSGRVKRSKIIITRGEFAFIRCFPDGEGGSKVMGEIMGMISSRDQKTWKKNGEWPEGFDKPEPVVESAITTEQDQEDEQDTLTDLIEEEHEDSAPR